MSKLETPLTRRFWQETGGTLIEEFPAVRRSKTNGARLLDGLIVLGGKKRIARPDEIEIAGQDVIVVQTKASRLSMPLAGQALLSAKLMERFEPASVQSVAVCTKGDSVLEPLLEQFGIRVVVYAT
ncbi:MAG: hypothetical protein PHR27_10180 [Candidatus Cloacimonetes bacterium]|nr:hypothetical protein [Candidatus Cloacimonadota bacterium]